MENAAHAIALAATHPAARERIYNVGEEYTPTIAERLEALPARDAEPDASLEANFEQNIAYDTARIRQELGYREPVSYAEGLRRTLVAGA